ncbi:MAG: phospho-N-acetylmuramoyl-pentapeptide-transferase [bacterium]
MMYALYQYLYDPEGFFSFTRVFRYITFRTAYASVTSGVLCWLLGRYLIPMFRRWNLAQRQSRAELDFQQDKTGTPTMGGLFIVISILFSCLFWADLTNRFVLMSLFVLLSLGIMGALDDWIQMHYTDRTGLSARTKILAQLTIAFVLGVWIIQEPLKIRLLWMGDQFRYELSQSLFLPFLKSTWIPLGTFYIPFVMLVVIGGSNAVNLTDGLDGLAVGCIIFVAVAYGSMAYITGHYQFSRYLRVPNIKGTAELVPFVASIIGAGLGFLWYNAYPAQIFMGDAGSLPLGGAIATVAVLIKQELLLVLVGGIFVAEALSVMLQVFSYKLTGNRLFEMAPLHHHFELKGLNESKITIRFWIVSIALALLALSTLKLR